jgi:hypothetical protein
MPADRAAAALSIFMIDPPGRGEGIEIAMPSSFTF